MFGRSRTKPCLLSPRLFFACSVVRVSFTGSEICDPTEGRTSRERYNVAGAGLAVRLEKQVELHIEIGSTEKEGPLSTRIYRKGRTARVGIRREDRSTQIRSTEKLELLK